jgi:hypothetical protein
VLEVCKRLKDKKDKVNQIGDADILECINAIKVESVGENKSKSLTSCPSKVMIKTVKYDGKKRRLLGDGQKRYRIQEDEKQIPD